MKLPKLLRRIAWPLIATAASILLYLSYEWAADTLALDQEAMQLVAGTIAYFASAWLGGRLVGVALERSASSQRRVPKLLQELVSAAFFLAALIATIMLILGQSMSGALASSGLVLAVLGFAIRNVVADALSGIALGLEAPYRIGDWVDIDGVTKGRIVEIGWRTTRLLTRDSTYMILPNSQIARQKLTNYSAPRRNYRAQVQLTVSHQVPVERARTILAEAAARSDLVLHDPAPDARALSYESGGMLYAVRYWVPSFAEEIDCRDSVLGKIDVALRDHDVPPPHEWVRIMENDLSLGPAVSELGEIRSLRDVRRPA